MQSEIASNVKYKMFPSEETYSTGEIKTNAVCRFPVSFAKTPEKIVAIRHHLYERNRILHKLEDFGFPDNVERRHELDILLNSFPMKDLKSENSFPIRGYNKVGQTSKTKTNLEISMEIDCFNKISGQNSFPSSQIKSNGKFPLKKQWFQIKSFEQTSHSRGQLNLLTLCTHLVLPKFETIQLSNCEVIPLKFPMTKSTLNDSRSKVSRGDKLYFPTKTEVFLNACIEMMNKKENKTLSLTMTQCRSFVGENFIGEALVETYIENQTTNFKNSGHEQKEEEQQLLPYLHNYNDDVLATDAAKNIDDSGQPKSCDELPSHCAAHLQYSRSTSETQCSHKNMDDFEKHHPQQQNNGKQVSSANIKVKIIKEPSPSPPPLAQRAITAQAKQSVRNTVQKEKQNYDDATNAQINIPNNFSDINFEHWQQPRSTYLTHSEVRDPSSQEDQIVDGRVACEPNIARTRIRIEPTPPYAAQPANEVLSAFDSSNYQLTTTLICPALTSAISRKTTTEEPHELNECQSLVSTRDLSNVKSDVLTEGSVSATDGVEKNPYTGSLCVAEISDFVSGVDIAMTVTKFEEQKEEDNISVSSSYLDDNPNSFVEEGSFNEMKFEMNGANNASNGTPRSLGGSGQFKNEQRSVLSAANDISKLENFGKARRESDRISNSMSNASLDAQNSVLPTRTLLRRQRRMQSQGSEDKQEDPIERLNRLRARISGALSEVKGVLKHYSTDEGADEEQNTIHAPLVSTKNIANDYSTPTDAQQFTTSQTTVNEDRPVSFRFIRKVRRRSVFSEEEPSEVKKEVKPEATELYPVTNECGSNSSSSAREDTAKETEKVEVSDQLSLGLSKENDKNLNLIVCSSAVVTTLDQTISGKHEENNSNSILNPLNQATTGFQRTDMAIGEIENQNSITKVVAHLETVKEEKHPDESSTPVELKPIDSQVLNLSKDESKKVKKRIIKLKGNARRASIAAVESSQISPPINATIPFDIKTQRRPSDPEAITKRKVKASEPISNDSTSTKNFRLIVKEKRPPVKKISTISKAETIQFNNSTEVAVTTLHKESNAIDIVDTATAKTVIKEPVPTESDSLLSTQLTTTITIDDALLNDTKTEATQPLSIAPCISTNTSRPTKLSDENGAMVAALANQLWTDEASSHTSNAEKQKQPSTILIDNAKVVTPIIEEAKDQHKNEDHSRTSITVTYINTTDCKQSIDFKVQQPYQNSIPHCSEESHILKALESIDKPNVIIVETLKANTISNGRNSLELPATEDIPDQCLEKKTAANQGADKMPEQQVTPGPVKPVQVFAENDPSKISIPTKKTTVKRIVRKNSVDKVNEKNKSTKSSTTESEKCEQQRILVSDNHLSSNTAVETSEYTEVENVTGGKIKTAEEPSLEPPITLTEPKKPRKVKKKVIIKRQQRKLSVGETSFFKEPEQPDASPTPTETLEKTIAYVTDDEDDTTEQIVEVAKPVKSCMKQREFQVGDWVLYGERFRKTQIRWKKGQIIERITSISYKIKIDDKEVSAHISYIKKYTERRVSFGGKEYLEIDYEQIAEEERRARTYSIWNMV